MKIEKINDNKIKITLSAKDLADRNLDFQSLRHNSPEAQTLFWDMMKLAESEHGFTASNCQLFIEAASVTNGNFIVTITKVFDTPGLPSGRSLHAKQAPSTLKIKRKPTSYSHSYIIRFPSFDNIVDALRQNTLSTKMSSALYEYKTEYYLVLKPSISQTNELKKLVFLLSEFGDVAHDFRYTEGIINEYGNKIIAKDALKVLNKTIR